MFVRLKKFIFVSCVAPVVSGMFITSAGTDAYAEDPSSETVSFDVTDYGANGGDSASDYSPIQRCLNEASSTNKTVVVNIPDGTYYIDSVLTIYSDTKLVLSDNAKIVRMDCSKSMLRSIRDYTTKGYGQAKNITVEGGSWDGNVTNKANDTVLMAFAHAQNITLKNTSLSDSYGKHMVIFAGVDGVTVKNVEFSDCTETETDGFYVFSGVTWEKYSALRTFEALHIDCISKDGISEPSELPHDGTANKNVIVEGCKFKNLVSGLGNHYSSDDATMGENFSIKNNSFEDVRYSCINVYHYDKAEISNNTASNCGAFAIFSNTENAEVANNNFTVRDSIEGDDKAGLCSLKLYRCDPATIKNNTFQGGLLQGIHIDGTTAKIIENKVSDVDKNAVVAINNSCVDIRNNDLSDAGQCGVYINTLSNSSEIISNTITNTVKAGISVSDCKDNKITISGNTTDSSESNGLQILTSNDVEARNNRVSNNKECGIYLNKSSGVVNKNIIAKSMKHGILASGGSEIEASDNTVTDSGTNGIYLYTSIGNIINNKIEKTGSNGIAAQDSAGKININKNIIKSTGTNGISANNVTADIKTNDISNANNIGISINKCQDNMTIAGNKVVSSTKHGLIINNSKKVKAQDNTLKDNKSQGLSILNSSDITAENNISNGNKMQGIYVSESKNVIVTGGDLTGNTGTAITVSNNSTGRANNITVDNTGLYTYNPKEFIIDLVTVKGRAIQSMSFNKSVVNLSKGEKRQLKVVFNPSDPAVKMLKWSGGDERIAKLDDTGKVTAVKAGRTKVNAVSVDGSKEAICDVRVLFDDVKEGHTFFNPIYWAADNNITMGVSGTNNFAPSADVTRGQVVAFVYRIAGQPKVGSDKVGFKDVNSSSTFFTPIVWATQNGVVAGYSDNTFREKNTCTRGQIVTLLWRYAGKPEPKTKKSSFKDVKSNNVFYKAILWAAENGITSGYGDGTFRATGSCTRGQMVAFLQRFVKKYK